MGESKYIPTNKRLLFAEKSKNCKIKNNNIEKNKSKKTLKYFCKKE